MIDHFPCKKIRAIRQRFGNTNFWDWSQAGEPFAIDRDTILDDFMFGQWEAQAETDDLFETKLKMHLEYSSIRLRFLWI